MMEFFVRIVGLKYYNHETIASINVNDVDKIRFEPRPYIDDSFCVAALVQDTQIGSVVWELAKIVHYMLLLKKIYTSRVISINENTIDVVIMLESKIEEELFQENYRIQKSPFSKVEIWDPLVPAAIKMKLSETVSNNNSKKIYIDYEHIKVYAVATLNLQEAAKAANRALESVTKVSENELQKSTEYASILKNLKRELEDFPLFIIENIRLNDNVDGYKFNIVENVSQKIIKKDELIKFNEAVELVLDGYKCILRCKLMDIRGVWITFADVVYPKETATKEINEEFYWNHVRPWLRRNGRVHDTVVCCGSRIELFRYRSQALNFIEISKISVPDCFIAELPFNRNFKNELLMFGTATESTRAYPKYVLVKSLRANV